MREGIRLIHKKIQELLLEDRDKLFIDAEKVAILQEDHTLEHAMLVLTNVRYSLIPVLNKENKIVGLISLAMILHKITGVEQIHMNQLGKYKVREVMRTEFPIIHQDTQVEDVLNELVDESFICIGNEEDEFVGIVTRKELLKRINFMVHELTRKYDFVEKENSK